MTEVSEADLHALNMLTPGYSPTDIQSHLYLSFLHGHTADVKLHVIGRWEALYHLHRVVLIQAGFFRSLFTAGFLESNLRSDGTRFNGAPDVLDIRFDDANITRAAFEVCVARLYGGGPELFLSPSLIPTTTCPLTSSFQSPVQPSQPPPGQHPATPRFLLSLLATSIYLSIPALTSQALSMVLKSVGPRTVHRYLSFAIGHGIGAPETEEPLVAVGLEGVGKQVIHLAACVPPTLTSGSQQGDLESDVECKLSCLSLDDNELDGDKSSVADSRLTEPSFNYGRIGDKIGEACACWLTRWGADMLPYEEAALKSRLTSYASIQLGTSSSMLSTESNVPVLWARGGLTASWVRALISSDDFFIKDEWERYDFARRVVDLRRREVVDPAEEKEWQALFQRGIYYAHMLFEDLICISQDISPITGKPYVPIGEIHSAHWTQSLLRHRIVTRSPVSGRSSPSSPWDKQLGISPSTADILTTLSSDYTSEFDRTKPYYPVPSADTSQRIGDADSIFASATASAEQLLGGEHEVPGPGHTPTDQEHFFGILTRGYTATSCIQADTTGNARWSPHAPMRFAIEFWGVDSLLEKSRVHSRTVWYAGSLFNVYVQVVRKKGVQLGVYLHRQSSVDPLPHASLPPGTSRADRVLSSKETSTPLPRTPVRGHVRPSGCTTTLPVAVPGSPPLVPSSPLTAPHSSLSSTAPAQPYRDPRSVVCAHFTISCASATGSSLTRFSSKPDQFAVGQSWGWKSSSLRTEEDVEVNGEASGAVSKEVSLRATVVLGLI